MPRLPIILVERPAHSSGLQGGVSERLGATLALTHWCLR